ncbi:aminopeptidase P family N-terminal domain-containing protein [Pseudocolwellia sp. HL-MZ19]|uniref:aminopeptidase P family N-terminal domain-containing protein n=1 Tax=unclassified Pseudocolwellia TaxID=2848178 RepID=UPI003CEFAFF4
MLTQNNMQRISIKKNIIDLCWNRSKVNAVNAISILDEKYHGKASYIKRKEVGDLLKSANVDSAIITNLDSICWLLNLRASDIPCLPVFYGTVLISQNGSVICFLDRQKLSDEVRNSFDDDVIFQCESLLDDHLQSIRNERIQFDPNTTNAGLVALLQKNNATYIEISDPISLLKSQKNPYE